MSAFLDPPLGSVGAASVVLAEGIDNHEARQKILTELIGPR